ncbi:unnamed protein product, partial [Ectocarpus sp. 13 AM-2016]
CFRECTRSSTAFAPPRSSPPPQSRDSSQSLRTPGSPSARQRSCSLNWRRPVSSRSPRTTWMCS